MKTELFRKRWTRSLAHSLAALLLVSTGVVVGPADSSAQGRNEIEQILKRFKNYRYGNVTVYRLENPNLAAVRNILKTDPTETSTDGEDPISKLDPALQTQVRQAVQRNRTEIRAIRELQSRGIVVTPEVEAAVRSEVKKLEGSTGPRIEDVYIITTRVPRGEVGTIIAMIATTKGNADIAQNLNVVTDSDIFTIDELRAYSLAATYGANNLYDYINTAIVQGAVKNVTADAQGLTDVFVQYVPREFGLSRSLIVDESDVTNGDIQQFIRISEGQPMPYYYPNEVIVSYDLISYRRYEPAYLAAYAEEPLAEEPAATGAEGEAAADAAPAEEELPTDVYNIDLPKYGVELRYGLDEINYPSLWSERLALNAIWQNAKLGVILPTSGWASLAESFGQERQLTHAGFGVNGAFNFPIKIIPSSGIFHANFGYVFDDAEPASYRNRAAEPYGVFDQTTNDYLVRFNAQLHYTFALAVDKDYMFRFGIGGTVYNVEEWYNRLSIIEEDGVEVDREGVFTKRRSETIGGISGRIEYMTVNTPTPYGFALQYFDESISGNVWLQIPIVTTLAVRLDGRASAPAFRDPHPWENSNVFIPSARVIWNF